MDFKLKIFVYLDDSLPTPEAILLVRQVFSQSPVFAGITPDISPASLHRLCITFTFSIKTTGQDDNKSYEFVQSLLECPVLSLIGFVKAAMFILRLGSA